MFYSIIPVSIDVKNSTTMKFHLPYMICIFLIIVGIVFTIAAIIANDIYVAGTLTLVAIISVLSAILLFFKLTEE